MKRSSPSESSYAGAGLAMGLAANTGDGVEAVDVEAAAVLNDEDGGYDDGKRRRRQMTGTLTHRQDGTRGVMVTMETMETMETGVFGDELKSESVMEGDSVTLQFNVTEIQTGDGIMWKFGTNRNLLAETDGVTSKIPVDLDERFRDRLKLDPQTGSLTITNITTEHEGVYEVEISGSSMETKCRFSVTVYAYEELLEVVTRAVDKLKIDWPTERSETKPKSKLDERFLPARSLPQRRGLPWNRPQRQTPRERKRLGKEGESGAAAHLTRYL
ncbi:hypothetical protein DPX16_1125 [Anabarilius grahami]|uniref:Immunoglobulin domain-containing protein n=1 Tax=Anabarilius grahami TaxID=495550 RepID=A0A3N0YWG6_ANAGA|nr:hypothetical protein DPX16_1125 [Anabarilius grahami]